VGKGRERREMLAHLWREVSKAKQRSSGSRRPAKKTTKKPIADPWYEDYEEKPAESQEKVNGEVKKKKRRKKRSSDRKMRDERWGGQEEERSNI